MVRITLDTKNQLVALFGNKSQDCICGYCSKELDEEGYASYYQCAGCERIVPYCFGQADRWFDYCDDCAVFLEHCLELAEKEVKVDEQTTRTNS